MTMNIRKKIVNLAVASAIGGAAVLSMPAHAINVSQNNVGQVLLFPYYTVKNGFDTVFTVTNTSADTVVVKIRFREALNSREVRDFNIVLSPYDMWTAAVTASGGGAVVRTNDKSCTSPALGASSSAQNPSATEVAFTTIGYDGTDAAFPYDGGGKLEDRLLEGYFEVISMGRFPAGSESLTTAPNKVPYSAKHVSGVPRDCAYVASSVAADYGILSTMVQPDNVLKGSVTYINVASGEAIDAPATHIEGFRDTVAIAALWAAPGAAGPDLANGDAVDNVDLLNKGLPEANVAVAGSENAVSVALMANAIINEFAADGVGSKTDWVVTYPTKHHYVDFAAAVPPALPVAATPPFSTGFADGPGKSCDPVTFVLYNREEGTVTPGGQNFSPAPTGAGVNLCYEANVVSFNGSNVFGTGVNHLGVSTTAVGTAGFAILTLTGVSTVAGVLPSSGDNGLPVIGFAAVLRNNAAEAGNNRNYGSTVMHTYVRN